MYKFAITLALVVFASVANAKQMICNTDSMMYKAIAWDTESKVAKMKDSLGNEHPGTLVATRPHDSGKKYNLQFSYKNAIFKEAKIDMVVFTQDNARFQFFGGVYTKVDEQELLSYNLGNGVINCAEL